MSDKAYWFGGWRPSDTYVPAKPTDAEKLIDYRIARINRLKGRIVLHALIWGSLSIIYVTGALTGWGVGSWRNTQKKS